MEYQYPLDLDWTNEEMMQVIHFFNKIENYYESSVKGEDVKKLIKNLKKLYLVKLKKNKFLKNLKIKVDIIVIKLSKK